MRQDHAQSSDRLGQPERLAYRVKEAADTLAISRSRFYELVAAGEIRVLKEGARTLVRRSELEAYLDRLEEAASALKRPGRRRPSPSRP
jgi:excisionase family DNA binding protein